MSQLKSFDFWIFEWCVEASVLPRALGAYFEWRTVSCRAPRQCCTVLKTDSEYAYLHVFYVSRSVLAATSAASHLRSNRTSTGTSHRACKATPVSAASCCER